MKVQTVGDLVSGIGLEKGPLNEFVVVLLFSLFIALVLDMSIIVFSTL